MRTEFKVAITIQAWSRLRGKGRNGKHDVACVLEKGEGAAAGSVHVSMIWIVRWNGVQLLERSAGLHPCGRSIFGPGYLMFRHCH